MTTRTKLDQWIDEFDVPTRWPDRLRVRVKVGAQSPAIADLPVETGD
jgi:hypothetical protein